MVDISTYGATASPHPARKRATLSPKEREKYYSIAPTISSVICLASPNSMMVLSA